MKTILAVSTATGALILAGCTDRAMAHVNIAGADTYGSGDGHYQFDRDDDVSLMGSDFDVQGRIGGDLSLIGSDLDVSADIDGDMSLVGSDIRFAGRVGAGADVAGSDVEWTGEAGGDVDIAGSDVDWTGATIGALSVAGSDVNIDGRIGTALDIAGSDVDLSGNTEVGGDVSIAGSDLAIAGDIAGRADLVGSRIDIDGRIDGRLLAMAYLDGGWSWSSDDSHQRIRINGRIGEGGAVCARRVEFTDRAALGAPLAVFAEEPPVISDDALRASVTYESIGNRDCDDLLEPYDR